MQPLAYRMRPKNLDEVVGQEHLVGNKKIIRRMVEAKLLSSMILYGPPGIGKLVLPAQLRDPLNMHSENLMQQPTQRKIFKSLLKKEK